MDFNVIKSYVSSIGFEVNHQQLDHAVGAIDEFGRAVTSILTGTTKQVAEFGVAFASTYAGISAAAVSMVNHIADADMQNQLFAQRMFMSVDAAKKLKIATDALGYSLDEIAWNPELRERFFALQREQGEMMRGLGSDFYTNMRRVRDIRFEFTRLKVELEYLSQGVAVQLFKAFEKSGMLQKLHDFNKYLVQHLPEISREISDTLVPILRTTFQVAVEVWNVVKEIASAFVQFTAAISGDDALKGEMTLRKFAAATEKWAEALLWVVQRIEKIIGYLTNHPELTKIIGGAVVGGYVGGPIGAIGGAALGAEASALHDADEWIQSKRLMSQYAADNRRQLIAQQALAAAKQVSMQTGVPADIVFAQWQHETDNFKNRGAQSLNNLAGVTENGGANYRSFASVSEFASYYAGLIKKSYPSALSARTPEEYAAALKKGGYYTDSYANYSAGMRRWYNSDRSAMHVDKIEVNITQPGASAHDVQMAVSHGVQEGISRHAQRNLATVAGPYN